MHGSGGTRRATHQRKQNTDQQTETGRNAYQPRNDKGSRVKKQKRRSIKTKKPAEKKTDEWGGVQKKLEEQSKKTAAGGFYRGETHGQRRRVEKEKKTIISPWKRRNLRLGRKRESGGSET